jgi:uncharacterized protein (TIGR03083 family)
MNMTTPSFGDLLSLIEDRSAALRTAVAGAPVLAPVPGCPDWSVHDLVAHLGEVQRFWAAVVAAGPADGPPGDDVPGCTPDDDLLAWSAGSTAMLIGALRQAGPDRGCWTWWTASGAPATSGAVARHQVQEAAVHGRDARRQPVTPSRCRPRSPWTAWTSSSPSASARPGPGRTSRPEFRCGLPRARNG